jgi:hypothetical protein
MSLLHFALVLAAMAPAVLPAVEVPRWVLVGILHEESRSFYADHGAIEYIDRRTGDAGELGPFQMTRDAFDLVARRGETFDRLKEDTAFAEDLCRRYLRLLYTDFSERDWFTTAGRWNAGPHGRTARLWAYAKRVQRAGGGQ